VRDLEKVSAVLASALVAAGCGAPASSPPSTPPLPGAPSAGSEHAPSTFVEAGVHAVSGGFESVMPVALTSFGGAVLADARGASAIYLAGGYFGAPHRYSREGQSVALLRYGPSSDGTSDAGPSWSERAPRAVGAQGLALVAHDGGLVRCGGSTMENAAAEPTRQRSLAECARYVPTHDAWEPFPSLPSPRSSFDAVSVGGRIVAVGGWDVQGEPSGGRFHETVAIFEGGVWREEPAPFRRRALAVAARAGEVVVIGGMNADQSMSREVAILDPETGRWSEGPAFPGDAFGIAAAGAEDAVYASGRDGVVYRLARGAHAWERVGTLSEGRFFHRLFVRDGALVAVGGIGSMTTDGRARLVEVLPLAGPRPRVSVAELDYPGATRNRPGLFVHDDSLYLFGGNDSTGQHDFAPENFETAGFRLHLPSLRWFALPALPEGRQSLVSAVHDGVAVAVGGFGFDGDGARTYADAFVLRTDEDPPAWQVQRDALPLARTQFGMALDGDALWVLGGLEFDAARPEEQQFVHLASVLRCPVDRAALAVPASERAPIGACEEQPAAAMPGTRRAFGSALLDGRVYVVGGMREDFAPVPDCAMLDLATLRWSELTCPSAVRISPDLLAFEGKLYLLGGASRRAGAESSGPDRSVEVFDPATGVWSTAIDALPFDTHQMRFAVHDHRLLGVSTQARAGRATLAWIDPR
jgi:hypothetical protein